LKYDGVPQTRQSISAVSGPKLPYYQDKATEIAGVDNVARAKKQGLKTREWTSRHEEAGVDIARVDNVARRSKLGQRGSGQGGTKKQE